MRAICRDAVFTLSHVHCPVRHAPKFESAAKWILPHCRLKETANGQIFEHLHPSPANLGEGRPHEYVRARSGFCARNATGCGEIVRGGDAVHEYMWFEEWRDWSGVEKHGATAHGQRFHSVLDNYIEEEWTFYGAPHDDLPPTFDPAACHRLPEARFFNRPGPNARGPLEVVHVETDARHALLDAFATAQRQGAAGDPAGARYSYMVLLENRFEDNQFVVLAEMPAGSQTPGGVPTAVGAFASRAERLGAALAYLRFGPAMWPEDWAAAVAVEEFPLASEE